MEVDSDDHDDSIWGIGIHNLKCAFTGQKGQKIMQAMIDELQFMIQQYRHQFLENKIIIKENLKHIKDFTQMLISLNLYK